ncbi:EAL domain-containing protein [Microbacterium sp. X-17]|uniref:putative bifunctional diguanylate cyclase/phosphodiesterase n=1 Tax=Microbacterium sp. X-17 TaxID=3144404 RepID=UPI0031F49A2D
MTPDEAAARDALTGSLGRGAFEAQLAARLAEAQEREWSVALLFIDLDDFKMVNDRYGHAVGDAVLVEAVRRCQEALGDGDLLGRMGGDEFAVAVTRPHRDGRSATVRELADRMAAKLARPYLVDANVLLTSASIGIALFPTDAEDRDELLDRADLAMYEAKASDDPVREYDPLLQQRVDEERATVALIHGALRHDRLEVHYQPIVALDSGRMVAVEALLRMRDAQRELVDPHAFLPVAARYGLMPSISAWVLSHACAECAGAFESFGERVRLCVNVPTSVLEANDFPDVVEAALAAAELDPERLELEITETEPVRDAEAFQANAARLQDLGVSFALDDFGSGFSGIGMVRALRFGRLKLDRSFVAGLATERDHAIVESIGFLAAALDIEVVAEGIETPAQAERLQQVGVTQGQSFLYAPPMPIDELWDWVQGRGGA